MSLYTFLVVSHIIGTVLGAGGATFAEILHMKALKDGEVSPEEGAMLGIVYRVIRIGLIILVISGFGFLVYYRLTDRVELLYDPKLWAKLSLVFIILVNALMLQARTIAFWLGSAVSLTSWYTATILGAWRGYPYDLLTTFIGYVVAVIVVAIALHFIKLWYFRKI